MRGLARYLAIAILGGLVGLSAKADPPDSPPGQDASGSSGQVGAATRPAPATFGGIRSPMRMGVRPAPVGPASARPAAVNASGSRPIASTIPTSASSWAARAGMQGRPDPKDASWASPAAAGVASTRQPAGDAALRRTQAGGPEMTAAPLPGAQPPAPVPGPGGLMAEATATSLGGQSMSLQLALYGALTGNPDLVSLRQGNPIALRPRPSRSPGTGPPR